MKKIAMIPARLGSKRVPKKNLRLILGKPLIAYIIEAAKDAGVFDEIYINSEADIFEEIAEEYGVRFYKRDPEFSTDATVNDAFALDFVENVDGDILFQLLPTSPLVTPEEIRSFVNGMAEEKVETYVSVVRHQIACLMGGKPLNFELAEKHRSSQTMEPVYSYGTVFMGWDTKAFVRNMEKHGSAYHGGSGSVGYHEVSGLATIDIDEEDDFQVAEVALQAKFSSTQAEPEYYESRKTDVAEVDVPTILKRDGVVVSDFDHENLPITNLMDVIEEMDSSVSWCRRVVNTESNSATLISQLPGEGNRLHYHPDWNEWWFILKGKWQWTIDGEDKTIEPGQLVFIPKNIWHKITAIGDTSAVRLAVSRGDVAHVYHESDSPAEGRK